MFGSKRLKNVKEAFKSLKGQNSETPIENSKASFKSKNSKTSTISKDAKSSSSLKIPISSNNKNKIFH